ncbi:Putative activity regulator of membrane protease YbbK [Rubrivivax sp. A210]|uniref:NfeD family protein n=1 Tax=Rubrivivax sp. A210 TaxID=2772301 RepID=UPI00191A3AFB|nr:NfeD family protein [Rubrivivax sp. A210]CAD5366400.1 Putative activity regulator of membrane protease YbbK [Rubrivivax sp. A210]
MDWNPPTLWWLAAGALVAAELATGTFYLLMLALGCAAAALAAHVGAGATAQVVAAALLGGGATVAWHLRRQRVQQAAPAESNADVNLDIGQRVQVEAWSADGTARVHYRGAAWSARLARPGAAQPGRHTIVAIHGSELQLAPATTD